MKESFLIFMNIVTHLATTQRQNAARHSRGYLRVLKGHMRSLNIYIIGIGI